MFNDSCQEAGLSAACASGLFGPFTVVSCLGVSITTLLGSGPPHMETLMAHALAAERSRLAKHLQHYRASHIICLP